MALERLLGGVMRRMVKRTFSFDSTPPGVKPPQASAGGRLLYVHIPFCASLCPFCTFHRVQFDAVLATRYFVALRTEISRYYEQGFQFGDVYFGGGTPTIVIEELLQTLELLRSFGVSGSVSVETNPDHLQPHILNALSTAGVNRLSVGVQSFDDRLLREMERLDHYGTGKEIAENLVATQGLFDTLNIDLMFNFPHQTVDSLRRDIEILHQIGVDQASFYPLMPAPQTRRAMRKHIGRIDFTREKSLYNEILRAMRPVYQASSAWCFSRGKAMIDEYIVDQDEYLGVGSGAFSYVGGVIFSTSFSIRRYIERIESGHTGIVMRRPFQARDQHRYTLLVGLFGLTMPYERLTTLYGPGARRLLWKELLMFRLLGAIRSNNDGYYLTPRGRYLWVLMMREFLMGVNHFREQMRHHIRHERAGAATEIEIPIKGIARRRGPMQNKNPEKV